MQPLTRGFQVGPYRLLEPLGSGGHASVWLAERMVPEAGFSQALLVDRIGSPLHQRVALKLLHAELVDDKIRARFAIEAQALRRLDTPDIVRILDAGKDQEIDYLAMEYVPRGSLASWAGHRQPPLESNGNAPTAPVAKYAGPGVQPRAAAQIRTIASWFRCTARGLASAHREGILHRDLKPSNILVRDDEQACLADFGVALADGASRLTTAPGVVGTLAYMAPELLRGEPASERSDIYSLCSSFAEVLSGLGNTVPQSPVGNGDPVRFWAPRLRNAGMPLVLTEIVLRGLRRDPLERYPSADLLLSDLEGWLAGSLHAAWQPNFTTRIALLLRRRRRSILVAVGALAVTFGTLKFGVNAGESVAKHAQSESQRLTASALGMMHNPFSVPRAARPLFEAALRSDGENLPALRMLVDSDIECGEPGRAARRLLQFQAEHQELDRADRWLLVRALRYANSPTLPDPKPILLELETNPPDRVEASEAIARARYLMGDGRNYEALQVLKSPAPASERPRFQILEARAWLNNGEEERAIERYLSWLQADATEDWISMLTCAHALTARGRFDDAHGLLDRAKQVADVDPFELGFASAHWLVRAQPKTGAGMDALRSLLDDHERAGKVVPTHFKLEYAEALRVSGRFREAIVSLESMPPRHRRMRTWRRTHCATLAKGVYQGRTAPAEIEKQLGMTRAIASERALGDLELGPAATSDDLLFAARMLLFLQRDHDTLEVARRLTQQTPTSASAFEVLGYAQQRLGNSLAEFEAFQRALELRTTDENLRHQVLHSGTKVLAQASARNQVAEGTLQALRTRLPKLIAELLSTDQPKAVYFEDSLAFAVTLADRDYHLKALEIAKLGSSRFPDSAGIHGNWGNILLTLDRVEEAYSVLHTAVERCPLGHELLAAAFLAAHRSKHFSELPKLATQWGRLPPPNKGRKLERRAAIERALHDPECPEAVKKELTP